MQEKVRVLIVGTGAMAQKHVEGYRRIDGVEVVGGVDINQAQLDEFCQHNAIEQRFASVSDAIAWGGFETASNATPDGVHHVTTLPLIAAGKHVLCEKPLAVNYQHALEMAEAAAAKGIVHTVNLTYREVPAVHKAAQMVAAGSIGEVRHFEASYLQSWLTQPAWGDWKTDSQWLWRLSTRHGSNGVVGDIGIHILDYVTYILGSLPESMSTRLHTFNKAPGNVIGEYALDANDSFVTHAQLPNGALGTFSATRFASGHHNDLRLRVYGDKGGMEVLFEQGLSRLNVCLEEALPDANWHSVACDDVPSNYHRFISAVRQADRLAGLSGHGQGRLRRVEKSDAESGMADFFRGAELQQLLDQMLLSE